MKNAITLFSTVIFFGFSIAFAAERTAPTTSSTRDEPVLSKWEGDPPRGGWNPPDAGGEAVISQGIPASEGPFLFLLNTANAVDNDNVRYRVSLDGKQFPVTFSEGSPVILEGRNLTVTQVNSGKTLLGTWQTMYRSETDVPAFNDISWYGFPATPSLVASFEDERLLVLSLQDSNRCTDEKAVFAVDGKTLKGSNGRAIEFSRGSSIMVMGKVVTVVPTGQCTNGGLIVGSISYRQ